MKAAAARSHSNNLSMASSSAASIHRLNEPEELIASTISFCIEPPAEPPSQVQPIPAAKPPTLPKTSVQEYEDRLSKARWLARSVSSFYSLSQFLALCSLTWATVVLLGAFVSDLRFIDYAMLTSLLLLEAIRLATAAFFTVLLTQRLARRSQDPQKIIHGRDDQCQRALAARLASSVLQAFLIAPSFVCPLIRFHLVRYDDHNLHISLVIFYLLVFANAFVSAFTLLCSCAAFMCLRDRHDQSMLRYYDKLVQNAISSGVTQASDFGFFEFAYRMLGGEYARNVQPEAVVKNHRKLVAYLYHHRLGQDFLLIYLDADDAFVQQAAVNMVGFWGDESKMVGLKTVKISKAVLTKMADKVEAGQVGWATVNSFGAFARREARILAETRTSSGMPLLERLAELVVETCGSSSLTFIRALVLFYHHSIMQETREKPVIFAVLRNQGVLVQSLKKLLGRGNIVQRVRVHSAYLLHLLGKLDPSCYPLIEAIDPRVDNSWFTFEESMLRFLITKYGLHLHSSIWPLPSAFVRSDD